MKLLTEVILPEYPFQLDHQSPILMMGSCFTENMGRHLDRYLFPVCINPFGITYNPLSVKKGLDSLIGKESYVAEDLDQYNDLWFSFDHYTGFSSPDREEALEKINLEFERAKEIIHKARFLILTWGTAWVYRYKPTNEVVCNCHKIPDSEFTRSRLTPGEIIGAYEELLSRILDFNPNMRVILTVSPVRHWKDGAHGNQLSKAALLLAGDALMDKFPEQFFYFPSYELVMDELRDYRFYTPDMIHTSDQTTEYIWEKFAQSFFTPKTRAIIGELNPLLKLLNHRPLVKEGESYRKLVQKRDDILDQLMRKYPTLKWNKLSSE